MGQGAESGILNSDVSKHLKSTYQEDPVSYISHSGLLSTTEVSLIYLKFIFPLCSEII